MSGLFSRIGWPISASTNSLGRTKDESEHWRSLIHLPIQVAEHNRNGYIRSRFVSTPIPAQRVQKCSPANNTSFSASFTSA